jgi:hypothetical protein
MALIAAVGSEVRRYCEALVRSRSEDNVLTVGATDSTKRQAISLDLVPARSAPVESES